LVGATGSSPAAADGVSIAHQWLRYVAPGVPAAGYFELHNNSDKAVLLDGAKSSSCGGLALHESLVQAGTARMKMVQSILVPSHATVTFQPGAYHLMCMSPTQAVRPGQTVEVTLQFQDHDSLSSGFPVHGAKG
jgi:hypothetical protein